MSYKDSLRLDDELRRFAIENEYDVTEVGADRYRVTREDEEYLVTLEQEQGWVRADMFVVALEPNPERNHAVVNELNKQSWDVRSYLENGTDLYVSTSDKRRDDDPSKFYRRLFFGLLTAGLRGEYTFGEANEAMS